MTARNALSLYVPVGSGLHTKEQFAALPVGAKFTERAWAEDWDGAPEYAKFTMVEPGRFVIASEPDRVIDVTGYGFALGGYNVVTSLPEDWAPDLTEPVVMTLEMFKQELVTNVWGSTYMNGIDRAPVEHALRAIGLDRDPITVRPGMMVNSSDSPLVAACRDIEGLHVRNPLGIHMVHRGSFNRVIGTGGMGSNNCFEVVHHPGDDDRSWMQPTGNDAAEVAQFKSDVWKAGYAAKIENRWCGEFEVAMRRMEIDASCVIPEPDDPGTTMSPDEARQMPIGSLFLYQMHERDCWILSMRTDRRGNAAGTERIGSFGAEFSAAHGHYTSRGMTYLTSEREFIRFSGPGWPGSQVLDALPEGSEIRFRNVHGEGYRKIGSNRWQAMNNETTFDHTSFGGNAWGITLIPGFMRPTNTENNPF